MFAKLSGRLRNAAETALAAKLRQGVIGEASG
jgi:hypothetical protein